jgi:hypothetical protein
MSMHSRDVAAIYSLDQPRVPFPNFQNCIFDQLYQSSLSHFLWHGLFLVLFKQ